jgi:hypothetical protein
LCYYSSYYYEKRDFADAVIVAGHGSNAMEFPVHRAVLAARSDFFHALFESSFCEGLQARAVLPDDAEIMEALLQHIYTGELPDIDYLKVLPAAHRLGLQDCVADVAAAILSIENERIPIAMAVLAPLRGTVAVDALWAKLLQKIMEDKGLCKEVLEAIFSAWPRDEGAETFQAPACKEAGVQTCTNKLSMGRGSGQASRHSNLCKF